MKPNWKDAPEWANWLAMDNNGAWYWYEHKPDLKRVIWASMVESLDEEATVEGWQDTLEERPKDESNG
jgi:hypothetical protein